MKSRSHSSESMILPSYENFFSGIGGSSALHQWRVLLHIILPTASALFRSLVRKRRCVQLSIVDEVIPNADGLGTNSYSPVTASVVFISDATQHHCRYADRRFAQLGEPSQPPITAQQGVWWQPDRGCRGPNRHVIAQTVPGIQTPVGNTPATYRSPTPNDQMMIAIAGGSMWVRP